MTPDDSPEQQPSHQHANNVNLHLSAHVELNNVLHPIDRFKTNWTDVEIQKYMTFCILDSNMQYARVCKAFDAIFANMDGTDVAEHLKSLGSEKIKRAIRSAGYAYYNKAARFLLKWANSEYSKPEVLRTADREDIVENITGIGFKLASMFLRNTRGDNVAVLDRHVVRWLGIRNYKANKEHYLKAEGEFLAKADAMHKTPYALDIAIWEAFRTKPQTGETVRSQKSRTKLERLNRKHNMCEKGEGC